MNTEVLILVITNIVAPVLTGLFTFYQTKKKYYSEVDRNLIDNMKESLEFYKTLSDDNQQRLQAAIDKNEHLEKEISDLKSLMLKLTMNICMDLTCKRRVQNVLEEEIKTRYSE